MTLLLDQTPATILPLETWRQWFGISPFRFWGLDDGQRGPQGCDDLVRQYPWQAADAASRSDVVQSIAEAEAALTDELGFAPGPRYAEITTPWPRLGTNTLTRWAPVDARGERLGVTLEGAGYVQAVGVESIALLGTATVGAGSLVYSDEDGDGLIDTFTATLTVAADTDPTTVAVYVPAADRFDGSGRSQRWQIRPIRASLSGVTLTVIGRSWTAVRPVLYEGMPTSASGGGGPNGLDPSTTSNYCQSLEVCTRTTDPSGETLSTCQAVLEWDSPPAWLWGWCVDANGVGGWPRTNQLDPAAVGRVVARCGVRDALRGVVLPAAAVRNATTGEWAETLPAWLEPDRVIVRVLAGNPDGLGGELQRATALLAAAMVTRPICACADQGRKVYDAQFDLTLAGRQDELYSTRDPDLDNPFGPRRGAVMAWKILKRLAQTRAFLLG